MRWPSGIRERLRSIFFRAREEEEMDEELRFHLEMETEANLREGMGPGEARRRAVLAFGGVERFREEVRDARGMGWMEVVAKDVRFALRSLMRNPGFTAVALVTLALGIGANAAMFSFVDGILLQPLPYSRPDQLVQLYQASPQQGLPHGRLSEMDFDDWQQRTHAFASMAAYFDGHDILTGHGDALEIQVGSVTMAFFEVLGVPAELGRPLLAEDAQQRRHSVVISDRLWRTRLGGDRSVIGSAIDLSGEPYTVVGVMPPDFQIPSAETDAWVPHSLLTPMDIGPHTRDNRYLEAVARLAPGVTTQRAQRDLNAVAAQLAAEHPDTNTGWSGASVEPLRTVVVGKVDRALVVLLGVVGLILLIACVNLANLLLARSNARERELAVRAALGADRSRLVRQLVTESLVLAFLGGALGLALAGGGVHAIQGLSADTLPRMDNVRVDGRVVGFGLLVAVLTGLLFGLIPALRTAGTDPQETLRGGRGAVGGGGKRLRSSLVVAEVTLAVVLVIGAGLMARSFLALRSVDPGFVPEHALAVSVELNLAGTSPQDVPSFIVNRREEIIQRVKALPGVGDVGMINSMPLADQIGSLSEFTRADGTGMPDGSPLRADARYVNTDYFRAMRIPLLRGDPLPDRLADDAPVPMLINEAAANRFWPGMDPVGQTVNMGWGMVRVTGVVGNVRQSGLSEEPAPAIYLPQRVGPRILATIIVRTAGEPLALAGPIRAILHEVDPNQPIRSIATLQEVMSDSIAQNRFFTFLFAAFGLLALALATVGIYGVVAYSTSQRSREIGVRMALGAHAAGVLRMVVGSGMRLVAIGIGLGTVAALVLTRVLQSQLYGITATDPVTFIAVPAALVAVGLLASYLPARRATRVDPAEVLRAE